MTSTERFWTGMLFRPCVGEDDCFSPPDRRSDTAGCATVLRIEALPFPDDIERAAAAAPQAEPDLRAWQEAWDRSFPNWWQTDFALKVLAARDRGSISSDEVLRGQIERFRAKPGYEPALTAFRIEKRALSIAPPDVESPSEEVMVARTLRAASAFSSFARLTPFVSAIHVVIDRIGDAMAVLNGHDDDGVSRLSRPHARYGASETGDVRFDDDLLAFFAKLGVEEIPGLQFWTWDFLRGHLGRTVFGVGPTEFEARDREIDRRRMEERRILLAGAIADMAAQRISAAVLSPRDINGGTRSRLLDLTRVDTIKSALDLLDNTDRFAWASTVEPLERYMTMNRYFFHDGRMIGSTCVDPAAHPYDAEVSKGFDRRLTFDVTNLVDDGEFNTVDSEDLAAHEQYARDIGALLQNHGVMDFALDVGLLGMGTNAAGSIERDFRVLAVSDLWSADTYSLDYAVLAGCLRGEAALYSTRLDAALDALASHSDFGRLAPDFREVVESYGRGAMIARLIQRSSSTYCGAWDDETVKDVIEESVVHYVRLADEGLVTPSEKEAAEDKVSFLRYDGFHEWLLKYWDGKRPS
ncbi:hypothetical protein HFO56_23655 [Rhizobium laguerreae]|uniref:hypothetical protein n=1 Tax=Rhizobium laguerreae TaxID=1076926 RepID=UPI001C8FB9E1|nr:hypothetical protein [Rhizobium laguerreae]MBY3155323.1 hypothetical protein [Rhizobium laguerreae]